MLAGQPATGLVQVLHRLVGGEELAVVGSTVRRNDGHASPSSVDKLSLKGHAGANNWQLDG